ncbi:hemicentin-2 [Cimex lectularius]|uniref:Ig-like domain-containing protein n=1 Tax=Cimex lectularius TaxID=79782 RepID=A0A8I6TJ22_CIMLE|nr:hemicentin-2 [Cimex lectularius]
MCVCYIRVPLPLAACIGLCISGGIVTEAQTPPKSPALTPPSVRCGGIIHRLKLTKHALKQSPPYRCRLQCAVERAESEKPFAPQRPRIEYKSTQVLPGNNVTARAGEKTTVKCISRYGNPPAKIKWFLGETELIGNHTKDPEMDNPRTWVVTSVVAIHVEKVQHGKPLRCVAIHESYPTKVQSLDVRLDVTFPPEVRLVGAPTTDLEENRDNVVLRCVTDANPPASVVWRKVGRQDVSSLEESLQFRPVTRKDSGTYTCQARNSLGPSEPLTVNIDVKFGPVIKSVGPDKVITASLFNEASFDCEAEASPTPSYQWLQRIQGMESAVLVRSNDARLHIRNVSYHHQGEYICRVWNYIGGSERSVQSDPVSLQVVGAPQVLRGNSGAEVVALRGADAVLGLVVCADPRPQTASWEWGSLHLQVGEGLGRYHAEKLVQETREDCYEARLHVREVDPTDSRTYFLTVENERGTDKHYLRLAVRGSYTNGNEKSDMSSMMSRKSTSCAPRMETGPPRPEQPFYRSGPHSITAPSPDAMKVRLAAMVLQPPTRV